MNTSSESSKPMSKNKQQKQFKNEDLNKSYDKLSYTDNTSDLEEKSIEERKYHCRSPNIFTIDNFLTTDECEHMIKLSEPNLKQSLVSGAKKGVVSEGRTGKNCWLTHYHDEITGKIAEKIAKIVELPVENAEAFQMIHYDVGEEYKQHYDGWLFDGCERSRRNMKHGGQRMKTALCYLNSVEEGGSTYFPRLDLHVYPEKGKMVVFQNVIDGTHDRHPLSEHCAMPVVKGHKWGFNLWFRESSRKKIYDYQVDPKYLQKSNCSVVSTKNEANMSMVKKNIKNSIEKSEKNTLSSEYYVIDDTSSLYTVKNFITQNEISELLENSQKKFKNTDSRQKAWIPRKDYPELIERIENLIGISNDHYENIFVVNYSEAQVHREHFDAYDLSTDNGKKFTEKEGQRIITISGVLRKTANYSFRKLNKIVDLDVGDIILYRNVDFDCSKRNEMMTKRINFDNSNACMFNIYIREKSNKGITIKLSKIFFDILLDKFKQKLSIKNSDSEIKKDVDTEKIATIENKIDSVYKNNSIPIEKEQELSDDLVNSVNKLVKDESSNKIVSKNSIDYIKLLETVYNKIDKGEVLNSGYSEMIFNSKVPWNSLKDNVLKLYKIRNEHNGTILNMANFNIDYYIDETTPVIIENVYILSAAAVFKKYIELNIYKGAFVLGDKQANRYKAHNESFCRFMHYELLPLVEKIVGITLEPTYTYLSCYKKGTDLPAHTDRPECEYTVSYIIDKPKGVKWDIYLHKEKQTKKNKGRSNYTPDKSECLALDCNSNGLMIFKGEDHLHFREKLEADYYNIVLLHYRDINKKKEK